jgi:putative salt-induced outer membrane protein YdiY
VISGEEGEVVGKLVGVRDKDLLLVGEDPATASALTVSSLFDSVTQKKFDDSALLRLKSRMRYWKGHYDLAFAGTDATVNSLGFATGFEATRTKTPTHLLIGASYRLATTNDPDGNDSKTELNASELLGLLRGEYDLTPRFYAFASFGAEYDEVENVKPRLTPKAGPGIRILNSDKYKWDADIGGSYVYERYNGGSENKYWAVAFGTDGSFTLPWGMTFKFRGSYQPAVDDWARTYLLNGTADLIFPMTEWLAFKTGVIEQYNNTPAEDTSRNSVTGTAGLSLVF